jgi:hypothetical protein
MRLSEKRIQFIAQQIAKELLERGEISYSGTPLVLESEVARIISDDMRIEDEIDQEVVEMISRMKRNIPQGSAEWDAIYQEKKAEIARRRNYVY